MNVRHLIGVLYSFPWKIFFMRKWTYNFFILMWWYEKTGLNGYMFDLSVDCDIIDINDITNIHRYLMKKHDVK